MKIRNNTNNFFNSKNKGEQTHKQLITKAQNIHQQLSSEILLATTDEQYKRILAFVKSQYSKFYPEVEIEISDNYPEDTIVFYTEDQNGNIVSSASINIDGPNGLPYEHLFGEHLHQYRQQQLQCIVIGRFAICPSASHRLVKAYYKLFYQFSTRMGFDIVLSPIRAKDMKRLISKCNAVVLCEDTGKNYGGNTNFGALAWPLAKTNSSFFKWTGAEKMINETEVIYQPHEWDHYARMFASVQTHFQRELQLASAELLSGDVADFGCGSAKLAPFLADKTQVTSYVGIDCSPEMTKAANWLINQFDCPTFSICESKIENYNAKQFDCAVSINSYYTWPQPEKLLAHIYSLIKNGGIFVLATPNTDIDMEALDKQARKEMLTHPYYEQFAKFNLDLAKNTDAKFIEMSDLITQIHQVGFRVKSCHQSFYLGGMNFLVLQKPTVTATMH